jgi:uncharacterized protein (TIGR00730 family)
MSKPGVDSGSDSDPIADLIARIRASADALHADRTSRGDLKILSRTLRELRYAFKVFAEYRHRRKVTVFGSARTLPTAPAYEQAVSLGRALAARDWMVITGAGSGIMEAGHRGSGSAHAMGLNIMLPFEQGANEVILGDPKLVSMKYFFTRKLMFVKECDGVVCLPGGFGTLDEAMEVLTLLQTGKREMMPVVLLDEPGGDYWADWQKYVTRHLLQGKMISSSDLQLYKVCDQVEEAVDELLDFYRVYHSMRYVGPQLVLRIERPLTEQQLAALNDQFADLLQAGRIEQRGALPAESDEHQLAEKPRLVLKFNRRSFGRLRQLIDAINQTAASDSIDALDQAS